MTIDAHHHFWHYSPEEFGWIGEELAPIRRDFLPSDLEPLLHETEVDGVVSVQARQSLAETEWLLQLASIHSFVKGVVGWADLRNPALEADLERLVINPKLRALRHVIQDEPDGDFILGTHFNRGVSLLKRYSLVYDILIHEHHLPRTLLFVDRHPEQLFVLDHLGKPRIRDGRLSPWREQVRELARRPHVFCKLSGMVSEAHPSSWDEARLRPYFEIILEAFGPKRLMFGSDWPVCLGACPYQRWHGMVRQWISALSAEEQAAILGETAAKAYRL